ncbi:hypothetical protein ACHAWF_008170 [Thalassiosira exigua]
MDALAAYGSDSDSDEDDKNSDGGALSGLLGRYSDESDGNEHDAKSSEEDMGGKTMGKSGSIRCVKELVEHKKIGDSGEDAGVAVQPKKRRRRWDVPDEGARASVDVDRVLPPPPLLASAPNKDSKSGSQGDHDHFQSMVLFNKDYTTELRRKLSQQLESQSRGNVSRDNDRLVQKLGQLRDKFQQNAQSTDGDPPASSFTGHLKSQHEFGNPHLLKSITDHFNIAPLDSHVGNSFKAFEYVDRLISAEERARIAMAELSARGGSGDTGSSHISEA